MATVQGGNQFFVDNFERNYSYEDVSKIHRVHSADIPGVLVEICRFYS